MPNLKNLKNRIRSVSSTRKITKAMKMVSASKLRRARESMEESQPYAFKINQIVNKIATIAVEKGDPEPILSGTGKDETYLLILLTSDRGLCGPFNGSLFKNVKEDIKQLEKEGKKIKLFIVGSKGAELFKNLYQRNIIEIIEGLTRSKIGYEKAEKIADKLLKLYKENQFDLCKIYYNHFTSVISQTIKKEALIPFEVDKTERTDIEYEYEPHRQAMLMELLPMAVAIKIYKALLDSLTSEHAARMTAMDNATRNAEKMIRNLNLIYNRTRQAAITKELIEIISGAEAI